MESSTVLSMFELSGLTNIEVESDEVGVFVEGEYNPTCECPSCGSMHIHRRTKNHRLLHLPPVGTKRCKLQVLVSKRFCVDCQKHWWPPLPFAQGKERMTISFKNYIKELLRFGTIKDVADHVGVSWDSVKSIHKEFLLGKYEKIDLQDVEYVSVDEFSIAKRHRYMTIFVDIKSGRIIHAIEGRKREDVVPFLETLKKKHLV